MADYCKGCHDAPGPGYCETCQTVKVHGAYTRAQLHAAFELVQPRDNWKMPIRARVPLDADCELIDAAIVFYCGGGAAFRTYKTGIRVNAPGYYALIGS